MPKITITQLVSHMQKYKDALFILGPGAGFYNIPTPTREQLEANYSSKTLRRKPEEFWPFFKEFIFIDPDQNQPTQTQDNVQLLREKGVVGAIVTQTTDGSWEYHLGTEKVIQLHGTSADFVCMNSECKTHFTHHYVMSLEQPVPQCEVCGKELRPNILLFGEKYRDDRFEAFKHHILTTHTLILIGVDFTEEAVMQMVANYVDMKTLMNAQNEDEKRMAVVINPPSGYDVNEEIGFFEFIVDEDSVEDGCGAATNRLVRAFW